MARAGMGKLNDAALEPEHFIVDGQPLNARGESLALALERLELRTESGLLVHEVVDVPGPGLWNLRQGLELAKFATQPLELLEPRPSLNAPFDGVAGRLQLRPFFHGLVVGRPRTVAIRNESGKSARRRIDCLFVLIQRAEFRLEVLKLRASTPRSMKFLCTPAHMLQAAGKLDEPRA